VPAASVSRASRIMCAAGCRRAQHVQFLLGKVADVQALAFGQGAAQQGRARATVLTRVDLPWPLAPSMPRRCPACTERVTLCTMTVSAAVVGAVAETGLAQAEHGVGQLGRFLELEGEVGLGQHRGDFSMRSSALTRLCACLALVALALKRSMNFCRWAILSCWRAKAALLLADLLGPHVLEAAVVAAIAGELAVLDVQRDLVTASRNSRSWLMTSSVPS
jgi:hypothetical protein